MKSRLDAIHEVPGVDVSWIYSLKEYRQLYWPDECADYILKAQKELLDNLTDCPYKRKQLPLWEELKEAMDRIPKDPFYLETCAA